MNQSSAMSSDQESLSVTTINKILTNNYKIFKRERETAIATMFVGVLCFLVYAGFIVWMIDFLEKNNDVDSTMFSMLMLITVPFPGIGIWLVLTNGITIRWHLFNRKKLYEVLLVQSLVIRRSYMINFDLVEPVGKDRLEKIFNHLCMVFPQINDIKEKKEKRNENYLDYYKVTSSRRRFSAYKEFQLVLRTSMGLFLIKTVDDKWTLNDFKNLINNLNRKQFIGKIIGGMDLFRVVIVTNQFNDEYNTIEFKEKLSKIPRKYAIDIIYEDEYGYSIVSID